MQRRILLIILFPLLSFIVLAVAAAAVLRMADINPVVIVESIIGETAMTAQLDKILGIIGFPLDLLVVAIAFLAAFFVSRISYRLAGRLLNAAHVATPVPVTEPGAGQEQAVVSSRRLTTQQLIASLISFTAFTLAAIFALSQFISLTNLAVLATVLANAFGFAARDYVGDLLNGLSNLFEDRFDVGDNIEIVRLEDELRGIVEQVNIRTMGLRTRSGELVIVPQGQVRILRNFSRGAFTGTDVTVSVTATDLLPAMQILTDLAQEAPNLLPNLIEPWRLISRQGDLNSISQLVIYAKAAYGQGVQLRLEIMTLVQQRLEKAGIELAG